MSAMEADAASKPPLRVLEENLKASAVRSSLDDDEKKILDQLIGFLASPEPWCSTCSNQMETWQDPREEFWNEAVVLVSCGNWYDRIHKAAVLAAGHEKLNADLLLTGGRDERFTSKTAYEFGREPLLLQQHLTTRRDVPPHRMITYSGSRNTKHNLMAALNYADQLVEPIGNGAGVQQVHLHIVEEAFLVRREAAYMAVLLQLDVPAGTSNRRFKDRTYGDIVKTVRFTAVGPHCFEDLVNLHRGLEDVVFALLSEELGRLRNYSSAEKGWIARNALEGFEGTDLEKQVVSLYEKHADILEAGLKVLRLESKEEFRLRVSPIGEDDVDSESGCFCS